jgi:gamma-aminobutyric acid type B receptor
MLDVIMGVLALALDRDYLPVPSPNEFGITQNEYGINVEHRSIVCDSSLGLVWIAIMFFTKFLIQVAALFFAIKTRKVKIKVLNDAKWIGIIIYITTVILTGLVIGAIALRTFINADAAVYSFCLIVGTTVVLLILFIPKWYHLYKDPHGEKIFERGNLPSFSSMTTASPNEHEIKLLNAHIEKLESRLGKYEAVTPYQSRRRVFSTPSSMENSTNNPRMAALRLQTPERSISPAVDVTASLPVGRLTPLSSPTGANGGGPQIKESSIESSEDDKGKNGQLSIVLEDEVESSQQELVKNVETSKVSFSNEVSISPANI